MCAGIERGTCGWGGSIYDWLAREAGGREGLLDWGVVAPDWRGMGCLELVLTSSDLVILATPTPLIACSGHDQNHMTLGELGFKNRQKLVVSQVSQEGSIGDGAV